MVTETEQESVIQLDSVVNAVRACMGKKEFAALVKLEERCRRQREEITRLTKELSREQNKPSLATASKLAELLAQIRNGSKLRDGYGKTYVVQSFGPSGFVDGLGGLGASHDWATYKAAWELVDA